MLATQIGKGLVLAVVVFSLLFAGTALAIYTNRIDWPGASDAGEVARIKTEVDAAQKAAGLAQVRLDDAATALIGLEAKRAPVEAWYREQIAILLGDKPGAIHQVALQPRSSSPILGEGGLPVLRPTNPPLKSRQAYQAELDQVEATIGQQMAAMLELIRKEEERTIELNGVAGKLKGLRNLVDEESQVKKNAEVEMERLRPLRYNFQVESEILAKRQSSLQHRLDELKGSGLASRRP